MDFEWSVVNNLHGSDHFAAVLQEVQGLPAVKSCSPRWKLGKSTLERIYGVVVLRDLK